MKQVGLPLMDGIIDVFYAPTDSVNPTTVQLSPVLYLKAHACTHHRQVGLANILWV